MCGMAHQKILNRYTFSGWRIKKHSAVDWVKKWPKSDRDDNHVPCLQ
jgi:hypothetical protein